MCVETIMIKNNNCFLLEHYIFSAADLSSNFTSNQYS